MLNVEKIVLSNKKKGKHPPFVVGNVDRYVRAADHTMPAQSRGLVLSISYRPR